MARKTKRMALNEAIRRGQAKVNEGLKTGQMRSDGPSAQGTEKQNKGFLSPRSKMEAPDDGFRAFFMKSKEKAAFLGYLSPKTKLIALFCIAWIAILALGIWLTSLTGTDQPDQAESSMSNENSVSGVPEQDNLQTSDSKSPESMESKAEMSPETGSLPSGDNVIWIQSIQLSRKDELKSLQDFFISKGIETQIIGLNSSNLAVLMTREGFEGNPSVEGTEGHMLLERIKQLGAVYVEETEDTKFGAKPFQDVLGYKRQ